ncbi:MAG TPA: RNA methyltransferase [Caulobacteraceae bacterium]|nr:RNA methyltransferase [Caulobacteraceae bacterium]
MAEIIEISDPDDRRIADYRHVRDRDLAGRGGLFIAEGEVVLRVLARNPRHETLSLLIARQRLDAQAELIAAFPPQTPVYAASQAVMDAVVGFPIHRGLLGIGRRAASPPAREALVALPQAALAMVLFGIANHDNMGGLFRNAAAFGVDLVILDPACCDPLYRKAIRVSVGGALAVPFARLAPGEDAIRLLREAGFEPLALSPSGRETLAELAPPARPALLLGAEGPGLPDEVLARARTVSIPMAGGFDSLNVATTSGIVLHHLRSG